MTQWVKVFDGRHDDLNLFPGTHMIEEENRLSCPLTSTHMLEHVSHSPHPINKYLKYNF